MANKSRFAGMVSLAAACVAMGGPVTTPAQQPQPRLVSTEAGEDTGCTISRLRGPYVFSATGFRSLRGPQLSVSAFSPLARLGRYVFDGAGHVVRSVKVSFAGQASFPLTDAGTYLVNDDCSGTIVFPTHSETMAFNVVSSRLAVIATTTLGDVDVGTLEKQLIHECTVTNLRGSFVFTSNTALGTFQSPNQSPPLLTNEFFPVSVIGNWNLDGRGLVSRSLSVNFGGALFPYGDVGSYQVNADCTASAYFASDHESFEMILIDSRRAVLEVGPMGRFGVATIFRQADDD